MKNEHVLSDLNEVVDRDIRLQVYKETLEILKQNLENPKGLVRGLDADDLQLCLLIPCVLWGLDHYLGGGAWIYSRVKNVFPEFGKELKKDSYLYTNEGRAEVLTRIIKKMDKKSNGAKQETKD